MPEEHCSDEEKERSGSVHIVNKRPLRCTVQCPAQQAARKQPNVLNAQSEKHQHPSSFRGFGCACGVTKLSKLKHPVKSVD